MVNTIIKNEGVKLKPVIKWAGSKLKLQNTILQYLPDDLLKLNYIDPFCGNLSTPLNLLSLNKISTDQLIFINDINKYLIDFYKNLRLTPHRLIKEIKGLETTYNHSKNREATYYGFRELLTDTSYSGLVSKGAVFYALNRLSFNGLFRVNKKGEFNVPWGKVDKPVKLLNENNFLYLSKKLQDFTIDCLDFRTLSYKPNSFYYLDPPYRPIKETSFTAYSKSAFNDTTQRQLKQICDLISRVGSKFLLHNSYSEDGFFRKLYHTYNIHEVSTYRSIAADKSQRGHVKELIITNY